MLYVLITNAKFHFIYMGGEKLFLCILQLSQLKKEDVVALAKSIDGFLSSDIGKMAQVVVVAAFPKMKIVKDTAMPILRLFIKMVKAIAIVHTFFPFAIST